MGSKDDVGQSEHLICRPNQGTVPVEGGATGLYAVVALGGGGGQERFCREVSVDVYCVCFL